MISMDATGESVFKRTYALTKPDGTQETWEDVVTRVVDGNLAWLKPGQPGTGERERQALHDAILKGAIMPAGRHLRTSGTGHTAVFNCFVTGWQNGWARGHGFLFERLLEGGGVGTNYSYIPKHTVQRTFDLTVMCDAGHQDIEALAKMGVVSDNYELAKDTLVITVEDSRESWVECIENLIEAHFSTDEIYDGVDKVIFDVSVVRPAGAPISGSQGTASGPEPLVHAAQVICDVYKRVLEVEHGVVGALDAMEIDHGLSSCVQAGGVRRSARMSILHWRDPDVMDFIKCKTDGMSHWTTNISVAYDDEFILMLGQQDPYALSVLQAVIDGMAINGEPGLWNESLSQEGEDRGQVVCTNPCGEIPMSEFGNCNLGHLNLDMLLDEIQHGDIHSHYSTPRLLVRYLLRATEAPLPHESGARLRRDRRLGLGLLNIVLAMAKRGLNVHRHTHRMVLAKTLKQVCQIIDDEADRYSSALGVPTPIKTRTIAPTGSVSFLLTGATSGAQPPMAQYFIRRIRYNKNSEKDQALLAEAEEQGLHIEPCVLNPDHVAIVEHLVEHAGMQQVRDAGHDPDKLLKDEIDWTLEQHAEWLAFLQEHWADNAISYTATFESSPEAATELFEAIVPRLSKLKGFTALPTVANYAQLPIERLTREEFEELKRTREVETDSDIDENCKGGSCPI